MGEGGDVDTGEGRREGERWRQVRGGGWEVVSRNCCFLCKLTAFQTPPKIFVKVVIEIKKIYIMYVIWLENVIYRT